MNKKHLIWILAMILLVGSVNAYFETSMVMYNTNQQRSINDTSWLCGWLINCTTTIGDGINYYYYQKLTNTYYTLNRGLTNINWWDVGKLSRIPTLGIPLALGTIITQYSPTSEVQAGFQCYLTDTNLTKLTYIRTKYYVHTESDNTTEIKTDVHVETYNSPSGELEFNETINTKELTTIISELFIETNTSTTIRQPSCILINQIPKYPINPNTIEKTKQYMQDINDKYKLHQTTYRIFQIITLITNLIMELWTIAYWIIQLLAITFVIGLILYIFIFLYKLIKTILES